ncbi:hypothetical protein QCA50_005168 [Cerrena zonata]|uniref:3-oxo-5-alpha-steroid 4-dehydrogenase C-terminal domain-containing protein n=1 Tax=Cerrena zonata TaxID=2478898 RepID=A0AAW0GPE0_9APHY
MFGLLKDVGQMQVLYDVARKWFAIVPTIVCPINFLIVAPFGRFAPTENSIFLLDGVKSWIAMELVSPSTFIYTFLHSPLSLTHHASPPPLNLTHPPTFLSGLFLLHYLNRALISPLRTPSRSKSHIIVPLSGLSFNVMNGFLMGSYLSSSQAEGYLEGAFRRPMFWLGVGMWVCGLAGNILHDEILLNLRRNAKAKGKARASDDSDDKKKNKQEHYAIPHGYLYKYISYPNYFCEWMEWLGFALAASPLPSFTSLDAFFMTVSPPFLFFMSEIFLMIPRAYRGHKWYHTKFPHYPKERKAVVPFLF